MINNLMNNNGDPRPLIQQFMGNTSPEEKQKILTQAKQLGVPDNVLSQIQNMK